MIDILRASAFNYRCTAVSSVCVCIYSFVCLCVCLFICLFVFLRVCQEIAELFWVSSLGEQTVFQEFDRFRGIKILISI